MLDYKEMNNGLRIHLDRKLKIHVVEEVAAD
jgi:hypothetical protein